jgi:hypothetical protein
MYICLYEQRIQNIQIKVRKDLHTFRSPKENLFPIKSIQNRVTFGAATAVGFNLVEVGSTWLGPLLGGKFPAKLDGAQCFLAANARGAALIALDGANALQRFKCKLLAAQGLDKVVYKVGSCCI